MPHNPSGSPPTFAPCSPLLASCRPRLPLARLPPTCPGARQGACPPLQPSRACPSLDRTDGSRPRYLVLVALPLLSALWLPPTARGWPLLFAPPRSGPTSPPQTAARRAPFSPLPPPPPPPPHPFSPPLYCPPCA